jgi:hypothetical protein
MLGVPPVGRPYGAITLAGGMEITGNLACTVGRSISRLACPSWVTTRIRAKRDPFTHPFAPKDWDSSDRGASLSVRLVVDGKT